MFKHVCLIASLTWHFTAALVENGPDAVPKPNSTTCNSGANTCYNGLCVGSICSNYGRQSCECTDVEELCHVCCASGNEVFFTYCIREINNDVRDFSVLQHFKKQCCL